MPGLPFGQQNMADSTLPVILLDDALAVSKAILRMVLCTLENALPRDAQETIARMQSWMDESCIIHELENILGRGSVALNTPQIYTTLKQACLTVISTLQHAFGHSRSYRQGSCLRVGAWIHLNSLDNFSL